MDSFGSIRTLDLAGRRLRIAHLPSLERRGFDLAKLPFSLRILLENLLRREDGRIVRAEDIEAVARWRPGSQPTDEIAFMPARVLLQDFTGVPAVADLAAMRDAMAALGGDPERINPLQPVELVIDHSVQVDEYGTRGGLPAQLGEGVRAQRRALRLPALGAERLRQLPGGAAVDRHRAPGEPRVPGARGDERRAPRTARAGPIPTRWSAPTRTPP